MNLIFVVIVLKINIFMITNVLSNVIQILDLSLTTMIIYVSYAVIISICSIISVLIVVKELD